MLLLLSHSHSSDLDPLPKCHPLHHVIAIASLSLSFKSWALLFWIYTVEFLLCTLITLVFQIIKLIVTQNKHETYSHIKKKNKFEFYHNSWLLAHIAVFYIKSAVSEWKILLAWNYLQTQQKLMAFFTQVQGVTLWTPETCWVTDMIFPRGPNLVQESTMCLWSQYALFCVSEINGAPSVWLD